VGSAFGFLLSRALRRHRAATALLTSRREAGLELAARGGADQMTPAVFVVTPAPTMLAVFAGGMANFFKFYMMVLTLRIYAAWFPNINLYTQPFSTLGKLTDPYLRVFRGIIPPIFGMDWSALLAFMLLTFLIDVCSGFVI
jgi:YggT family protein